MNRSRGPCTGPCPGVDAPECPSTKPNSDIGYIVAETSAAEPCRPIGVIDDRRAVRTRPTLSSTLSEMSSVLESSGSSSPDSSGSLLGGLDGKMLVILKEVFLRRAKPSSADNIVVFCDDDRLKTDFNKDIFLNNSNNKNVSTENVRFQNELYFVFFLFLSFFSQLSNFSDWIWYRLFFFLVAASRQKIESKLNIKVCLWF